MFKSTVKGIQIFPLLSHLGSASIVAKGNIVTGVLFIVLFFPFSSGSASDQIDEKTNLTTPVSVRLIGNGSSGPYQLANRYILEGTEEVKKNGILLLPIHDYSLDYDLGLISFSSPLSSSDTVQIDYTKLDLNLRRKYFHRELVYSGENQRSNQLAMVGGGEPVGISPGNVGKDKKWSFIPPQSSSELSISGSKTFSLEVGSAQDVSLKQGLWLQAKGQASRNAEILLQVSDQNLPATPEGTTKRLEELDKVQLTINSPHFTGTLGDYYLKPSASNLFSYEKKLKGITSEVRNKRSSLSVALASSQGEYYTNRFEGEESKQGPYYLKGKNGESDLIILAGTERVWVDGEELQRGSGNDYTIDYSRGSIQFTPRRLITSDSRITVDFEYSLENYQRDLYSGNLTAGSMGGKIQIKAGGMWERDNNNHPADLSLTTEDKSVLKQAGDDRSRAVKDGAKLVGAGEGSYNLDYDSTGNAYYRYLGVDSGSYQVTFSWVGEKKGSYRYLGGGIYQYVYPNNGDYLPVIFLPLPESHSLLDLNLSYAPTPTFNTQIEWAGSQRDQNTFSSMDDAHNRGDAVSLKTNYQNSSFDFLKSDFNRLEFSGGYSYRHQDFSPFGRTDEVDKERKWNLPSNSVSANEEIYQFSGLVSPYKIILVDFDYGKLDQAGFFNSRRGSWGAVLSPAGWISVKGGSERINSREHTADNLVLDGYWNRNSVSLSNRIGRASTVLSWEQEERATPSSDTLNSKNRFDQFSGRLNWELSRLLKTNTDFSYRDEDGFTDGWMDKSASYTWHNLLSLENYRGMLSTDLELTRRIKRYQLLTGRDSRENLVATKVDFHPPSQLLNVNFYHSQNQIYSAQQVYTYVKVDEGKGDYVYEDGEYFQAADGDYVRQEEWLGDAQSSLDLNKSLRVIFSPDKLSTLKDKNSFWARMGKLFSTDSFLNLHGRFTEGKAWSRYLLYPLTSLPEGDILSQNLSLSQDLYLLPDSRSMNFQLRWEKNDNRDGLLSGGAVRNVETRQEIYLRSCFSSKYSFESRVGSERIDNALGGSPKYAISGKSVKAGLTQRTTPNLELKLSGEYKSRLEKLQQMKVNYVSLIPEILWSFLSCGRLKTVFQWEHISSNPRERSIPYILTEGKNKGENYDWRFSLDYRLSQYLTSSAVYSGEAVPREKIKHTGRMELKAYF
jgi:hypothetical protein